MQAIITRPQISLPFIQRFIDFNFQLYWKWLYLFNVHQMRWSKMKGNIAIHYVILTDKERKT